MNKPIDAFVNSDVANLCQPEATLTTREEVEALAKWHEHQLTFVPDGDNALSKHHTNAAALLRSLLAERDELKETQLKFGTMMHEVMAERDEAIKHGEAMARMLWQHIDNDGEAHVIYHAFRKWMEERGK